MGALPMKRGTKLDRNARNGLRLAKLLWPAEVGDRQLQALRELLMEESLSVAAGDVLLLDGKWYVTHIGLLRLARRRRCAGIDVRMAPKLCDPLASQWSFKATVFKSQSCRGFVGYGDANPSNVSAQIHGAEMRVAETRAVNRALRKAYGIGICSVEELGQFSGPLPLAAQKRPSREKEELANGKGHRPLRDRLCLLVRQHHLDAALVKAYAAEFCDVAELRQAKRDQIASFIAHLSEYAQRDREGLLCQLNSYARKPPGEALVQVTKMEPGTESEKAAGVA